MTAATGHIIKLIDDNNKSFYLVIDFNKLFVDDKGHHFNCHLWRSILFLGICWVILSGTIVPLTDPGVCEGGGSNHLESCNGYNRNHSFSAIGGGGVMKRCTPVLQTKKMNCVDSNA